MNVRNNKRRRESQEKIERAFIELLQTREIKDITVSDLIKTTELNRSTFYAYYTDIYDLHQKILKEFFSIQKNVIKYIKEALMPKSDIAEITYDDYYNIISYYLKTVTEYKPLD